MGTVEKLSLPMLPKSRVESSLFITKSNPQDFVFLHTFLKSRRKVKGTFGALKGKEYGHVRSCMALYGLTRLCTIFRQRAAFICGIVCVRVRDQQIFQQYRVTLHDILQQRWTDSDAIKRLLSKFEPILTITVNSKHDEIGICKLENKYRFLKQKI